MEITFGQFSISDEKARLDIPLIHRFLSVEAYWAKGRAYEVVVRSIDNSWCFGVYDGEAQVGFARLVTDYATFAWLCDVFILPNYRGRGLSKKLVESITQHPDLVNFRRILLATRDAHELYARYGGFTPLKSPERWMELSNL